MNALLSLHFILFYTFDFFSIGVNIKNNDKEEEENNKRIELLDLMYIVVVDHFCIVCITLFCLTHIKLLFVVVVVAKLYATKSMLI